MSNGHSKYTRTTSQTKGKTDMKIIIIIIIIITVHTFGTRIYKSKVPTPNIYNRANVRLSIKAQTVLS